MTIKKNKLKSFLKDNFEGFSTGLFLILFLVFFRLIPHPPNFSPIFAVSFFLGFKLKNTAAVSFLVFVSLVISDLFLGFYPLAPAIYMFAIIYPFIGKYAQSLVARTEKSSFMAYTLPLIGGSVSFFLFSNIMVWFFSGMYQHSISGLITCFSLAIPFYQNSLAGDLFYTFICFALSYFIKTLPNLVGQKVN